MKLDLFTRVVLSIIAVCAILLVARSFGLGESSGIKDVVGGRYRIAIAGPIVFRVDTETGRTWRSMARNAIEWTLIDEPFEETVEEANDELDLGFDGPDFDE